MARNPWMKFYPQDWRGEAGLRMVSLAARGLWIEAMCLMHEADPYGHLVINGRPVTATQLAALTGTTQDQVEALLTELENAGVFSRNRNDVVYSRRMTRDDKRARNARKNGKNGGNPTLGKTSGISPPVNPSVKGGDKPQKPDTRSQREKEPSVPKKGSRLDSDWTIPDDWISWAVDEIGLSVTFARDQAARFHDYWLAAPGQKGVKADWQATWRNWVRKAANDNPDRVKPTGRASQTDDDWRVFMRLLRADGRFDGPWRGPGVAPRRDVKPDGCLVSDTVLKEFGFATSSEPASLFAIAGGQR